MPDDEIRRARTLRIAQTGDNKRRAKIQMAGVAAKYKKLKDAMIVGSISKASFEKGYKLAAQQIAAYRKDFSEKQQSIDESWALVVAR